MPTKEQLKRNLMLLFFGRAFISIQSLNAIITLFYLRRGVSMEEIFYLSIVWSVVGLLTEVPSGYLADRIGRKRTLIIGTVIMLLAELAMFFAYGFPAFVGLFILMSLSYSFFSGTEEALLFESLKELGREGEMTHFNGRLASARSLFKIFVPAVGAYIARDLTEPQFQILIWVNVVTILVALLITANLSEPKRFTSVKNIEKGIFTNSLRTLRDNPFLWKAGWNRAFVFVALFISWRVSQPVLFERGLSVVWIGATYVLFALFTFSSQWFLGALANRWGEARLLRSATFIVVCALAALAALTNPWISMVLIVVIIGVGNIRDPLFARAMNIRIESESRATTLSNINFFKSLLDIPIMLTAGWVATADLRFVMILAIVLCLVSMIGFPLKESDMEEI